MKRISQMVVGVLTVLGVVAFGFAGVSTVSSHATPKLVSEINTALANPVSTSLTVTNATASPTITMKGKTNDVNFVMQTKGATNKVTLVLEYADADLLFKWGSTEKLKGDSSGNFTAQGDVTASDDVFGDDATFTGGDITGGATNSIQLGKTDGLVTLKRATAGTVTVSAQDNNADCALTIASGGTGAMTIGTNNGTIAVNSSDWDIGATGAGTGFASLAFDNGATISNAAADTLTFMETKVNTVGDLQDDGYAVVCGNHATTELRVDAGTVTNGQTVTFTVPFSATPNVVITPRATYTGLIWRVVAGSTADRTNFVAKGFTPGVTCDWFAVGAR